MTPILTLILLDSISSIGINSDRDQRSYIDRGSGYDRGAHMFEQWGLCAVNYFRFLSCLSVCERAVEDFAYNPIAFANMVLRLITLNCS